MNSLQIHMLVLPLDNSSINSQVPEDHILGQKYITKVRVFSLGFQARKQKIVVQEHVQLLRLSNPVSP
jgi:hypothetical protein